MNNFAESFSSFSQWIDTEALRLDSKLSNQLPVVIYGAGYFAQKLKQALLKNGFNVLCFVETLPQKPRIADLDVHPLNANLSALQNSQLVVGIFNRDVSFASLNRLARDAGYKKIFMPWDYYEELSGELGWCYWLGRKELIFSAMNEISEVYAMLSDDCSKQNLLRILRFRLGGDLDFSDHRDDDRQYFNQLTLDKEKSKEINYVDCGAYRGEIAKELSRLAKIRQAYLFEPDPQNYMELCKNLVGVDFSNTRLPIAVSDGFKMLRFSSGLGESGTIGSGGDINIQAVSLDLVISDKVDFIKIDVEGAEAETIRGAANLLIKQKPIVAISLYHKPADLWELPKYLKGLVPEYKLYIRQHQSNTFDSVLYASI